MDTLFVKDLQLKAIIGCLPWERKIKQNLRLSFELATEVRLISATDELKEGFDYAQISARIIEFVENSECKLIETLAQQLADLLQTEFSVKDLRLTLEKPGALPQASSVGVTIKRGA